MKKQKFYFNVFWIMLGATRRSIRLTTALLCIFLVEVQSSFAQTSVTIPSGHAPTDVFDRTGGFIITYGMLDRRLDQVTFFGLHNADITSANSPNVQFPECTERNQDLSYWAMIHSAGVRFFDMDAGMVLGQGAVAKHGAGWGWKDMGDIMNDLKYAMDYAPNTVYIINFSDMNGYTLGAGEDQKNQNRAAIIADMQISGLWNRVYNKDAYYAVYPGEFGAYAYNNYYENWLSAHDWPTLRDMISSGRNIWLVDAKTGGDHSADVFDNTVGIGNYYYNTMFEYGKCKDLSTDDWFVNFFKSNTVFGALSPLGYDNCTAGDKEESLFINSGERMYQHLVTCQKSFDNIQQAANRAYSLARTDRQILKAEVDYADIYYDYQTIEGFNKFNLERCGYDYYNFPGISRKMYPLGKGKRYKVTWFDGYNIPSSASAFGNQPNYKERAYDGDLYSTTHYGADATAVFDLGTAQLAAGISINEVDIAWFLKDDRITTYGGDFRTFTLEQSDDGGNWTAVGKTYDASRDASIYKGERTWWRYNLQTPITKRFIRISNFAGYSICELSFLDNTQPGAVLPCSSPANLNVTNRGAYSATLNWTGSGSNPVSYQVEYKIKSGVTQWNVAATNVTGTSFNLNNLISNTAYQWRVRTNCDQSISSDPVSLYAESSFTTTGPCGNPDNLVTSSIATNQAVVSWSPVPDAQTYYVFYRRKGVLGESFTLIQPVTGTSYTLTNLAYATQYEWTAGAVCTGNNQGPGSSLVTFTTSTPPVLCPALSAPLLTDFITGSKSLVMGWQPVIGANSYTVEYRQRYTATWLSAGNAIPVPSVTITGLFSGNSYEVRVRANCSASNQSFSDWNTAFFVTSFCEEPSALGSSNITPNSATVSWGTTSGATGGYQVQYRETASNTWTTVTTSQSAANSANITGLRPSTNYVWRVRSTCLGSSSIYVEASFTTSPPPCVSAYEPNDYIAQAAAIDPVTTLSASIDRAQDFDFYSITLANAGSIDIRLTNVPANKNYDLELYKPTSDIFNPTLVASSRNTGLGADEAISLLNQQPGTYYVRVFGADVFNDFSASQCYVLNVTATGGGCTVPTGLTSFSVTSSGATVSWTAVSGALDYTVEYKTSAVSTWTTATANSTATSLNLTGLTTSTSYDWRVRANCASGSSGYTQAQFTTLWTATSCNAPTGLSSSGITSSGATVSWAPVVGGTLYEVHYRQVGAINWLLAGTGITGTSFSITGLNASTLYEWRVITLCGPFRVLSDFNSIGQFTTSGAVGTPTRMAQTAGEALGDKEQPESGQRVMLYPNPVDDQLTIISTEAIRTVKLVSVSGQTLAVHRGMNKQMLQLPMGRLVQGVYIVQVITRDGKTSMHKVMKK